MSSADNPPRDEKFRIAIVGSGPIGRLLACSVAPHPCISYELFIGSEPSEPLQYSLGPEIFRALDILNPKLGGELGHVATLSDTWVNMYHGGDDDRFIETVKVPDGRSHGNISYQQLSDLVNSHLPSHAKTRDAKKLKAIKKIEDNLVKLTLEDDSTSTVNAVWDCDAFNSICWRSLKGDEFKAADYSGTTCYRSKVSASKTATELSLDLTRETYVFVGVNGCYLQTSPVAGSEWIEVTAFTADQERVAKDADDRYQLQGVLSNFPNRGGKAAKLLQMMIEASDGVERIEVNTLSHLEPFYNPDFCMTSFGDVAGGKSFHLGSPLSPGFIGVTAFLHDGLNPLIDRLSHDATNEEIASLIMEASSLYDVTHRTIAEKLVDADKQQGSIWCSGVVDMKEIMKRPQFLWTCADG